VRRLRLVWGLAALKDTRQFGFEIGVEIKGGSTLQGTGNRASSKSFRRCAPGRLAWVEIKCWANISLRPEIMPRERKNTIKGKRKRGYGEEIKGR